MFPPQYQGAIGVLALHRVSVIVLDSGLIFAPIEISWAHSAAARVHFDHYVRF